MPDRTSHGAFTLDQEYYTSQHIHDLETERIFSNRWLCIGLASTLPDPGSYAIASVEGEELLAVRGPDGQVRVFYNLCRHRGTRLCTDGRGSVGKHIVCPYHAWAYDLAGSLVAAPNMNEVEGFDQANYPLHAVRTHVWQGLVFINFDPDAPSFEDAYGSVTPVFDRWALDELVVVHRTEYDVSANWKLLFQNYSECYHCPSLHPQLNRLTPYRDASNDLEEGDVLGGPMRLTHGASSMTMDGSACGTPVAPGVDPQLVYYYIFFPSLFLSIMPDYALVHRPLRRSPKDTKIICEWLFRPEAVTQPDFDPSGSIEFWDTTNRQDWKVCELSQQGIGSRAYKPGPYSNLESMLAAIDREYLRSMDP